MSNDYLDKIYDYLRSQRHGYKPTANYASQCGHPCKRKLVYDRLNWEDKELFSENTLIVMREGNLHEDSVIRLLMDSGFKVTETQRTFEVKGINVRGKIDLMLNGIPTEIKSMKQYTWDKINSIRDLRDSANQFIAGYYAQMQMYLLMANSELGLFIFKNRNDGRLKFIECELDYDYAEALMKKMESVEKYVKKNEYPDRIEDRDVCRFCPFKSLCLPDEAWDQINPVSDQETEELLEKYSRLKPFASEFEKTKDSLKPKWESLDAGDYLYGKKFAVSIKIQERKKYVVPPEIKSQYAEKYTVTIPKIVNLEGKEDVE